MKKIGRIVKFGLIGAVVLVVALLTMIRLFLGGGEYYEDVSTAPLYGQDDL